MLEQVFDVIDELASTSKSKSKKAIIQKNIGLPYFKKVFIYALHPYKQFNVNKLPFLSSEEGKTSDPEQIFEFLDKLANKRGATTAEIRHLAKLSSTSVERWEIVNKIVNKDLRCGVNIKTARKFFPEIPLHEVCLAEKDVGAFLDFAGVTKDNLEGINWSLKKNGVRTWAVVESPNAPIKYISRNGKEFPNFSVFDEKVRQAGSYLALNFPNQSPYPVVFDGEVSSTDKDFQKGMTQFRRLKNADPSIFVFDVFDLPKVDVGFWHRYKLLEAAFGTKEGNVKALEHQRFLQGQTLEDAKAMLDHYIADGEEGLMFKTNDGPYEYKRSKHWCKFILYYNADLPVTGFEYGTGRNSERLGALVCDYNGHEVKVGSGYTDQEREELIEELPSMIEVFYKNETKDGSLFHPIFVRVREDK